MCSEKDEEQVCPTSNCYHYLENKRYVRLLGAGGGGGRTQWCIHKQCHGVIKHGTDYKMREAKQRGRDLTTGWGTPPFHPSLHTPLYRKSKRVTKRLPEVWFYVPAKAYSGKCLDTCEGRRALLPNPSWFVERWTRECSMIHYQKEKLAYIIKGLCHSCKLDPCD